MSRNGTLLSLPDDPRLPWLIEAWPDPAMWPFRSRWLRNFEDVLRAWYPQASSADLRLTARHAAPFYLRDGPNVP
jgi:hypothetical protein